LKGAKTTQQSFLISLAVSIAAAKLNLTGARSLPGTDAEELKKLF
jgi:hypothetical protein